MVPKLLFKIILKMYRRIKNLHHLDDSLRLFIPFLSILNFLEEIHHLLHISTILRDIKFYSLGII